MIDRQNLPCRKKKYVPLRVDGEAGAPEHEEPKELTRNLIAFFVCGLINNFGYVVMLSAAEGKARTQHTAHTTRAQRERV